MRLRWADLDRFRNLERQKVTLHPRYNLFVGRNGQGKTNFLEAIGFLGTLKSIRSASRNDMIRHGADMCRVTGEAESSGMTRTLSFALTGKGRVQHLDDKKVSSPEEYLRAIGVVGFIPEDVGLVSGSPSWRRKTLDRAVFEVAPGYVRDYRRYLAVLRHRNAFLRSRVHDDVQWESWTRGLAENGAVLVGKRLELIRRLNPLMEELGRELGLDGGVAFRYRAGYRQADADAGMESISASIHAGSREVREKERRAGHTLLGPHRDNIVFVIARGDEGELEMGRYGSQGQKRAAVLAFKLSLARVIAESRGMCPLVMLDDVASELDDSRRRALGAIIRDTEAQFLVTTTTEEPTFLNRDDGYVFRVEAGRINRLS